MKVLLTVGAVLVALLAAGVSGQVLSASGTDPSARVGQVRAAADEKDAPPGNPAARAFVAAKKSWTACVAKAAPAHDPGSGRFDPERACGVKPHPHDVTGKHDRRDTGQDRAGHGRPPWAGGPTRRTAEPPGHARRD